VAVKLSSLRADLEREETGDWVDYPDWPGVAFNVSSLRKPAYVAAQQIMLQRFHRKYKGKTAPVAEEAEEVGRLVCKHLLHGWRGLDEEYSSARALEILTDECFYESVLKAVLWCAGKISELDVEFIKDEEKNSEGPSADEFSGKANTETG